ncbi:FHF complex subunit HOOK-interacting protein 1B isoform X2 [Syngnathoides biaculeatus]|uniref:FHF complex subunit HOOK-interacting protein 1B isoform X2 n=1 Tax=Syngnathoides biaculeatus TaxID=300417 RepID=UPI002ADE5B3A|nr:FHF complex subunit HOOK-interacting protein 1B isoform X2 [Syngnathoides biaculeatus]
MTGSAGEVAALPAQKPSVTETTVAPPPWTAPSFKYPSRLIFLRHIRHETPVCTADPETCLMVFENHWKQVSRVLDQSEPSWSTDDLIAVRNHTDQMFCLLAEERPPPQSEDDRTAEDGGPILQLVVREQALLQRTAVLHPLLRLMGTCVHPDHGCPPALENSLVLLLNQVCVRTARQPLLLEMLFQAAPVQQGSTNLLIFSLLVPFIHREGAVGQQARDALLLVMAASATNRSVAKYIAHNSYFCPVLATGLSALYSSLPRKIEVRGDDWHALQREDWIGVSSLVVFMNSLEFCNAVVQVAHPMVRSQLLDYLHNGFLVPVVAPALHKSSVDEMIASTAYLDLFLRSVSETALLKTFLRFILLHRLDSDSILDTLLTRISSNSRLCMVSLSLFRTLVSFNCEDIMLQLVLRYLLPCSHVMLSQRRAIRDADMYGKCADKFLSLIPECCRITTMPPPVRDMDATFRGKVPQNADAESLAPPRPTTPSRLTFFIRQQSSSTTSGGASTPANSESLQSSVLDSPMHQLQSEILAWDSGYLDYLKEARRDIELCSWACRDWSAPYDGENPSASAMPLPPPPPAYIPSMGVYPEHFSFQPGGGSSGQQRATMAVVARSEWSSSDHDSGEWDVTIGQNNCISLTPRSKKRSLQCEELLPKPVSSHLRPSSLVPHSPTSPSYVMMHNGTAEPSKGCPGRGRELEAKKVKRDLDHEEEFLDENANQNGCPASGAGDILLSPNANDSSTQHHGPTVESLIQELLEQSPVEMRPPDDGEGISIEAFTQELRELEDRVTQPAGTTQKSLGDQHQEKKDPEDKMSTDTKGDCSGRAACSPTRPLVQDLCQPYTGPLMAVLLAKLENMLQNSLYVNILLTGIVAQLACYPQPLLRSFLLNTNMVFQPSIKSLIQVLGSVKNRIEAFAASHDDFPAMLRKAQQYLVARGKVDWSDPPGAVPPLRRSDSLVKSRKSSLSELILRHTSSPTRTRSAAQMALAHVRVGGQTLHSALFRGGSTGGASGGTSNLEKQAEALRVKNAVYCAVIFCEFLKELAALAQEHAVALPFARTDSEE